MADANAESEELSEWNGLLVAAIIAGLVLALPILATLGVVILASQLIWGSILRLWFWRTHAARGRPIMFVYSNSPNWQTYVEERILPRISGQAVVLNWSERRLWASQSPLESWFFRWFSGPRHFNPLALVFLPPGKVHVVRFHQAFIDFKHGKETALRKAEAELFELADRAA